MNNYIKELEERCEQLQDKLDKFNSIHKVMSITIRRIIGADTKGTKSLLFIFEVTPPARIFDDNTRKDRRQQVNLCQVEVTGFDKWKISDFYMDNDFFTQSAYECTETEIKEIIIKRLGLTAYEYKCEDVHENDFSNIMSSLVSVQPMTMPTGQVPSMNYRYSKPIVPVAPGTVGNFSSFAMPVIKSMLNKKSN